MAFPRVIGDVATSNGMGTTVTVNLPTGIVAGELLEVAIASDGGFSIPTAPGFTSIQRSFASSGGVALAVWMKIADGTEPASIVLTIPQSECWAASASRIGNHAVTSLAPSGELTVAAPAFSQSGTPNPPYCEPGGLDDFLFRAYCAVDDDSLTGAPTDYTVGVSIVETGCGTGDGATLGVAGRQLRAFGTDPGVFSGADDAWLAFTFAIPPGDEPDAVLYQKSVAGDLTLSGSLNVTRIPAPPVTTPIATAGALTFAGSLSVTAIPFAPPVTSTITPAGVLELSGSLSVAAIESGVPSYVGEVLRMEIELFDVADVWLDARAADESTWSGSWSGDNTVDADLLIGRMRWRDTGDRVSLNRTTASTGSLADARLAAGILNGLYLHVSHDGTEGVFTSDQIVAGTDAGASHIQLAFTTAIPAATGTRATIVLATNVLVDPMPVTSTVTPAGALTFAGALSVVKTTATPDTSMITPSGALTLAGALSVTASTPGTATGVPAYVGEVIRMEITVFAASDVWLDARSDNESFWDGTFTGDNEIDSDLFAGEIRWLNAGDRLQVRRNDASTGTMSAARLVGGTLNGLYAHISHDGTAGVLTSDMITAMTLAGTGSIQLAFSTAIPMATTGGTATLVIATNSLAGTTPVTSTVTPTGVLTLAGALSVTAIPLPPPVTLTVTPAGALTLAGTLSTTRTAADAVLYQRSVAGALTLAGSLTTVVDVALKVSVDTPTQNVAGGTVLQLAATATEADTYAWTATPDVGTFSDTAIEDPTWTAPATTAGTQSIALTLTVTGNGNTAADSVTIRVTGTGLLSVAVDGVTMPLRQNKLKIRNRVAERSTADLQVRDDAGDCPLCTANFGTPISVSSLAGVVFDGFIFTVTTRRLAPSATGTPTLVHIVRAMDNHYRADKRLVAASYRDMTAGEIALALWSDTLEDEGVTAAAAPAGDVYPGIDLGQVIFNYVPITTALDRLAETSNYVWWIGHDRTLRFMPRSTIQAPWTLTSDDIQGVPRLTERGTKYRNQQFVTGGRITTDPQVESFHGDGAQQTFVVGYPVATMPSVEVDTGIGYVAASVGIRGLETGHDWFWNKGASEISQELTHTPLAVTHSLRVTYAGLATVVAIVGDLGSQQARAETEGGTTTGIVDALTSGAGLDTTTALIQHANAQLEAYGLTGQELRFTTRRSGLESGQLLTIDLGAYGISGSYLISEVVVRDRSAQWLEWTVRAISGPISGSWAKFFREGLGTTGQDILENISETQDLLLLADGGDEVYGWTETVTQTVHPCPIPSATLYPSATLLPC